MTGTGGSNLTGSLKTCAQLQPPHVAHDGCCIECLLHGEREERERTCLEKKQFLCLAAIVREGGMGGALQLLPVLILLSQQAALAFCQDTDLPFTFGKVLLDLSADRFMDILVQSCVSRDPAKSSRKRQLTGS